MKFLRNLTSTFRNKKIEQGYDIAHYLTLLDRNPGLNFQLDFFRGDCVDLQIFRQKYLKARELEFENPNDYAVEVVFTLSDSKSKNAFDLFQESHLYKKSILTYEKNRHYRYLIKMKEDNQKLFKLIKYVIEELFQYDKKTTCSINFHDLDLKLKKH